MNRSETENTEEVRAFICIDMPDEVIKEVARVQELLGKWIFTGKMTELENLHLTLKFLGNIKKENVPEINILLEKVKVGEFEARLGQIGIFHANKNPKILWLKIIGEGIFNLQKNIDNSLSALLSKEERFMSHMTISRIRYVKDKKGFEDFVKNIKVKEIKFRIKIFYLKESALKFLGPIYTTLNRYNLSNF